MRIAILSVSERGKKLSSNLKSVLDEDPTIVNVNTFHKNVKDNIATIFNDNFNDNNGDNVNYTDYISYDAIIGIMATGILIRNITDKIEDKTTDPAIISMDDNGKYVISLVSGHLGRANELTEKIANLIDSEPVITTATDTSNKIGIDTLANKYYWEIANKKEILTFNKAILEEAEVKLYINLQDNQKIEYKDDIEEYIKNQKNNTLEIVDLKNHYSSIEDIYKSIFSSNVNEEEVESYKDSNIIASIASYDNHKIFFKPKRIVVGIGSRANVSKEKVMKAIQTAMNNLNLPIERIDSIATAEIKKDEKGILEAAKEINKPIEIVAIDEIKEFQSADTSNSNFVQEKFDIPGVAEPTSLIIAKKFSDKGISNLIHKKIAVDGVTVAVSVSN